MTDSTRHILIAALAGALAVAARALGATLDSATLNSAAIVLVTLAGGVLSRIAAARKPATPK